MLTGLTVVLRMLVVKDMGEIEKFDMIAENIAGQVGVEALAMDGIEIAIGAEIGIPGVVRAGARRGRGASITAAVPLN
jgi:hypothetical protein